MLQRIVQSSLIKKLAKGVLYLLGALGLLLAFTVTVLIFVKGLPLFIQYGPAALLLGTEWQPHSGKFGMLPLLLSTLYAMVGALVLCVPLAILAVLFIHGCLPKAAQGVCLNLMMVLARMPSVIYGLLGIVVLLPLLQNTFGLGTGFSLLAVILILGALLLPQMLVKLQLALLQMPPEIPRASLALGATETETWFYAMLPQLSRVIIANTFACAGRAVGETIVVAMVAGSISDMPGLLRPVSSLALEASGTFVGLDGETGTALFAVAVVLALLVALLRLVRSLLAKWGKSL